MYITVYKRWSLRRKPISNIKNKYSEYNRIKETKEKKSWVQRILNKIIKLLDDKDVRKA